MSTRDIVIYVAAFFIIGISYMIFSDEINNSYHVSLGYKNNTDYKNSWTKYKINGLLDVFYILLLYLCGIFILGDRIIKFLNKKFNKNYKEKENNDNTIQVANIGKIMALFIISVIAIIGISLVITFIFSE